MSRPRIGCAIGRLGENGRVLDAVAHQYAQAVADAGGVPLLLPALEQTDPDRIAESLDGVLLTGGGDVAPSRYASAQAAETSGVDPSRDAGELALVAAARARELPVLGICRGLQLLTVALGGSLIQHLPEVTSLQHLYLDRRDALVHEVQVAPGSRLSKVLGRMHLSVNSVHHQAVQHLAGGLVASAWARDGVIEGTEHPDEDLLGVQWHPELILSSPGSRELFAWVVERASARTGPEPARR
ncbi:MAG: yvdE [Acidimicrobiaceae bacterium]|nr:yvdE [Acidimicrobiaceae bacterium]